jgi:hypothetical protein
MKYPALSKVRKIDIRGPWTTRSGGELRVPLMLDLDTLTSHFLPFDSIEANRYPMVKQGLRIYLQDGIGRGREGAGEFHCLRQEIVFCTWGRMIWTCEDTTGASYPFEISPNGFGIWIPPGIMHTYVSEEKGSSFMVIANTTFDADNPSTHDSFHRDQFGLPKPQLPQVSV